MNDSCSLDCKWLSMHHDECHKYHCMLNGHPYQVKRCKQCIDESTIRRRMNIPTFEETFALAKKRYQYADKIREEHAKTVYYAVIDLIQKPVDRTPDK